MGEDVAHLSESHTMGTHDELEYGKEDTAHIFIYRASMGDQKYAPKLGIWVWRPKSMFIQRWWLERNFQPLEEQGLSQSCPREGSFPT